jgi:hypothetical protein
LEDFSGDGAQVADASAALIFLVRFCIKAKMNGIDGGYFGLRNDQSAHSESLSDTIRPSQHARSKRSGS